MEYLIHIIIMSCIYVILSISLNLITGYSGLVSLSQAALYGIGAYSSAFIAINLKVPFIIAIIMVGLITSIIGSISFLPLIRLHRDAFIILSFAFQVIIFNVMNNWDTLTGGPRGIVNIPPFSLFGWIILSTTDFLILSISICLICYFIVYRIICSPFGRLLKAIREDEVLVEASGRHIDSIKFIVLAISSAIAGVAGCLYASYVTYIDPTSFDVIESIFIISIVIIGGAGSLWGPVVGSVVLVSLPELLRFIGLPSSVAANLRQIFYGSLLVIFMIWRPHGLVGKYSFYKKQES